MLEPRKHQHDPLRCHEEHAEYLADARETTRVDLAHVYRLRLEQLLERHPIMRVLSGRDADPVRLECATDRGVSQDVVRSRWLFNEPNQCRSKLNTHKSESPCVVRTRA